LLGQFVVSREHNERATAIYDSEVNLARPSAGGGALRELRPNCAFSGCAPLWTLGFPDQARRKSTEAVRLAEQADLHVLAWALWHTTWLHLDCGDLDAARERIDRLVKMTNQYGLNPGFLLWTNVMRALLLICEGRADEAIVILHEIPWPVHVPLALAYAEAGQPDAALHAVNQAFEDLGKSEARNDAAEVHRLRGEILLMQPEPDQAEAERCMREAIAIARGQNAKSLELRATVSLAKWLEKRGQLEEARRSLSEIYNWFTEGLDTADLIKAKALLDHLSQ
jgi:tetratricopeptide (TPR) repeat protein